MDRRKFLGRFGLGLGAAALAPTIVEKVVSADNAHVVTRETISQNSRTTSEVFPGSQYDYQETSGIIDQINQRGNIFTYYTGRRGAKEFEKTVKLLLEEHGKHDFRSLAENYHKKRWLIGFDFCQ